MHALLCIDIVEMHGGSLYVTSQGEGYGCTFTIELPITITTTTSTTTTSTDNTRVTSVSEYHDIEVSLSGRERERGHTYGYLTGPDALQHSSKSIYSGYSLPSPHYTSGGDHTSVESEPLYATNEKSN